MRFWLIPGLVALVSCSPPPPKAPEQLTTEGFLDKAAKEPGSIKTPSGLIYTEVEAGSGASPTATDTVKVHYRGTLMDGTEFDSSYKSSEPVEFPLNRVIPCWTEGVQRMKAGGRPAWYVPRISLTGLRATRPRFRAAQR